MYDTPLFVDESIFINNTKRHPGTGAPTKLSNRGLLERFLREDNPIKALLIWFEHSKYGLDCFDQNTVNTLILKAIVEIDAALEKQVNLILHHQGFQRLEASWRGVLYLAEQKNSHDKNDKVKVKLLNCCWSTLSKDLSRAIEFDQSDFFKLIYNNEFDMSGGEPFGALIGDYRISHQMTRGRSQNDIDTLKEIARVAAAAFSPFITSVSPEFFGIDRFSKLATFTDVASQFEQPEYLRWRSLRSMEESRFLGITLPNILLRSPYQCDGTRNEGFKFREMIKNPDLDHLWGNAAFGFGAVLIRAYCESGWFGQIRGMQPGLKQKGIVSDLPIARHATELYQNKNKHSINLLVGDRLEKELSDNGFIPLSVVKNTDHLVFFSNSSVQKTAEFIDKAATVNAKLSSMMQYILCVSRFAHYIKRLGREKVGSYFTAKACESQIQSWLHQYTTASDSASDEVRSKYPLSSAKVTVKEMNGKPGHFYSVIHLQPHFQLDQMVSSIKLVTELSPRN